MFLEVIWGLLDDIRKEVINYMAAWEYFTSQKQWELYLKDLIRTNDTALLRSIVCIYNNQTEEEKNKDKSIEDNHIGFSKIDAAEMGEIARKIKAGEVLTKGELAKSRNKMQKYWKQLMIISKQKAESKRKAMEAEEFRKAEEEVIALEQYEQERLQRFREYHEVLKRCIEEGIVCEYGICDECPITTGFQFKLDLGEVK